MSLKDLGDYTRVSRYSKYLDIKKRRETWSEQVDRVFDMHEGRYPQIKNELAFAREMMRKQRVLGSQRALQFGGPPIIKKHARIYNCKASFCDRTRFFQEAFWLLLCGCGTGFSVQKHHVAKIPAYYTSGSHRGPVRGSQKVYIVEDTIEGWADAAGVLLSSFLSGNVPFPEYQGYEVIFDLRKIRKKGSPLSSSSGKAPGPVGLYKALRKIKEMLLQRIAQGYKRLRPIDCYDIMCHLSDAVLSGGVRRSAMWVGFSFDDKEMLHAKTGNWYYENPQRARSNNSVYLIRGKVTWEQFHSLIESIKGFGEPGFYWSDSTEQVPNPCVEIGMWPALRTILVFAAVVEQAERDIAADPQGKSLTYDPDKNVFYLDESGWQACNLSTIVGTKCNTEEEFYEACKAAAIIGTAQAGYTDFEYLGPVSEAIARREALLGVSITGINDSPDILLNPEILRKGAQVVVETNTRVAGLIGINPAARATAIKPEGTASAMVGSSSGCHRHHSRRYLRRVQSNKEEKPLQYFKLHNPLAVEESVWSANKTDDVLTFCIEVPPGARVKNNMPALEMLADVKLIKENWVDVGKVEERCTQPWLSHNVSNTVVIQPNEWEDVAKYIFDNQGVFSGISLLGARGDLDYQQAPFCAIRTRHELVKEYGDGTLFASGVIERALDAFSNNLWDACDAVLLDKTFSDEQKLSWKETAKKFATRYFEGDLRKMCYALKEVFLLKKWNDLKREWVPVDYTLLVEEEDQTDFKGEVACSGGQCEIRI